MAFDFPTAPAVGTLHPTSPTAGQPQYRWDGEKWLFNAPIPGGLDQAAADARYVNVVGDAMTGPLRVGNAAPAVPGDSQDPTLQAKRLVMALDNGHIAWNSYIPTPGTAWKYLEAGAAAQMYLNSPYGLSISVHPVGSLGATAGLSKDWLFGVDGAFITPGTINAAGSVNAYGGDLQTQRAGAPTQGLIFLGNSGSKYLVYDGINYVMPGAPIIGANFITNGTTGWGFRQNAYGPSGSYQGSLVVCGDAAGLEAALAGFHQASVDAFTRLAIGSANFNHHATGHAYAPGTWADGSDERIKTHFDVLPDPIRIVRGLRAYSYYRTNGEFLDHRPRREVGHIAQDVRAVMPEAVSYGAQAPDSDPGGERTLGVHTGAIVALHSDVLNVLLDRIEALEARLASSSSNGPVA